MKNSVISVVKSTNGSTFYLEKTTEFKHLSEAQIAADFLTEDIKKAMLFDFHSEETTKLVEELQNRLRISLVSIVPVSKRELTEVITLPHAIAKMFIHQKVLVSYGQDNRIKSITIFLNQSDYDRRTPYVEVKFSTVSKQELPTKLSMVFPVQNKHPYNTDETILLIDVMNSIQSIIQEYVGKRKSKGD